MRSKGSGSGASSESRSTREGIESVALARVRVGSPARSWTPSRHCLFAGLKALSISCAKYQYIIIHCGGRTAIVAMEKQQNSHGGKAGGLISLTAVPATKIEEPSISRLRSSSKTGRQGAQRHVSLDRARRWDAAITDSPACLSSGAEISFVFAGFGDIILYCTALCWCWKDGERGGQRRTAGTEGDILVRRL